MGNGFDKFLSFFLVFRKKMQYEKNKKQNASCISLQNPEKIINLAVLMNTGQKSQNKLMISYCVIK